MKLLKKWTLDIKKSHFLVLVLKYSYRMIVSFITVVLWPRKPCKRRSAFNLYTTLMSGYHKLFCITVFKTSQPFQSSCPCLKIHFKVRVDTLSNYLLTWRVIMFIVEKNQLVKSQMATIWRYLGQN